VSLVVNRATRRAATVLNRAGLSRVNRRAKAMLWRLARNRVTVVVDGLRISGPAESWSTLSQFQAGTLEPFEIELFTRELKPGMVVLDVGANIGCYALLAARRVGPSGRVYAFEPDPRTRPSLEYNVHANGLTNVAIVPKAASDAAGRRTLYLSQSAAHSGLAHSMDERSIVGTRTVETVRIDDVVGGQQVDVVKMDIEGNEPAALRGMQETLARSPAVRIFLEFNPVALQAAGSDEESFGAELSAAFSEVSVIDERSTSLRPFSLAEEQRLCNLYCRGFRHQAG
jgi:FkbM family methyltransferase